MKLYEILEEIESLDSIIDDGMDDESIHAALDALQVDARAKIDGLHKWVKNLDAEALAFAKEAARLAELAKYRNNKIARIKDYISSCVTVLGGKVDTSIGTLRIQQNGGKQPLSLPDSIQDVPPAYIIQDPKVDTAKLRADIEAAEALHNADNEQGQDAANFLQDMAQRGIMLLPRGKSLRGL